MKSIAKRNLNGGIQEVYRFDNGYGASVIRGGRYAYGGLELAVVRFTGEGDYDFKICYDTPVTDDVVGHLNEETLQQTLEQIEALKKAAA